MVAFLLLGYELGLWIRDQSPLSARPEPAIASPGILPIRPNGQRCFLLVNSSNLEAINPQLKSIWLACYIPRLEDIKLTPFYPSSSSETNRQIEEAFSITKSRYGWALSPRLLALLGQKNWWSGYLVLDDIFFAQLIDSLGGITISGTLTDGETAITALNHSQPGDHPSIIDQKVLLQEICTQVTTLRGSSDFSAFDQMVGRHILTDLNPEQVLLDWSSMLFHPSRLTRCEIPPIPNPEASLPPNLQP